MPILPIFKKRTTTPTTSLTTTQPQQLSVSLPPPPSPTPTTTGNYKVGPTYSYEDLGSLNTKGYGGGRTGEDVGGYTPENQNPDTPVRVPELIGIDDEESGTSRYPTPEEKTAFDIEAQQRNLRPGQYTMKRERKYSSTNMLDDEIPFLNYKKTETEYPTEKDTPFIKRQFDKIADFGNKQAAERTKKYQESTGAQKIFEGTRKGSTDFLNALIFQTPKQSYEIIKYVDEKPGELIINTGKGAWTFLNKDLSYGGEIYSKVKSYAKKDPIKFGAEVAVIATPIPFGKVKAVAGSKVISVIGKEVKAGNVFGKVTSKGSSEIISKFEKTYTKGRYVGVHTTSSAFNEFARKGKRKIKRIEDEGDYISQWGGANPSWLGIGKQTQYEFSLNPFKSGASPNIIKVKFEKLEELPKGLVRTGKAVYKKSRASAYQSVINPWYRKKSRPGTAYIPFRTVMKETPETQAIIPFKYDVYHQPEGNALQRVFGIKEYVKIKGQNIPIRTFRTAKAGKRKGVSYESNKIKVGEIDSKYYNYLSNKKQIKYITPYYPSLKSYSLLKRKYKSSKYNYKYPNYNIGYQPSKYNYNPPVYNYQPFKYDYRYNYKYPTSKFNLGYKYPPSSLINPRTNIRQPIKKRKPKRNYLKSVQPQYQKMKYTTKYTPSFTAAVFKIKGKKPKKWISGYSPMIRPIINQ